MKKMIMEGKLASELMDCLTCLYLSAYGDGTIGTYYELAEKAQEYARAKFIELTDEFESATGKQWDVTPYEEEAECVDCDPTPKDEEADVPEFEADVPEDLLPAIFKVLSALGGQTLDESGLLS